MDLESNCQLIFEDKTLITSVQLPDLVLLGTRPCKILDTVLQIQQWDDVGSRGILPYYHRLLDHFKQCPDDRSVCT